MPLYLVRHGKAGRREAWHGLDELRPLSRAGWAQAQGIAAWLVNEPVTRLLASPCTRCLQTLEPLGDKLGLQVEATELLREGAHFEPVLELLGTLPDHSALCSHGDVIQDGIEALLRGGTVLDGQPDWRKGATWVITRDDGVITHARAVAPLGS